MLEHELAQIHATVFSTLKHMNTHYIGINHTYAVYCTSPALIKIKISGKLYTTKLISF